ncbi:MAG: radical SAM protein [Peptococcaceae bacterium]|nr:radical SAM protein [Peptococcaceae bacterium]
MRWVSFSYDKERAVLYREAVLREMTDAAGKSEGVCFGSVYFGGGTPTCLDREDLVFLLDRARNLFSVPPEAETTVEANPGTMSRPYLSALQAAGVNRPSLGAQTFDESLLRLLGRPVGPEAVRRTVDSAREAGIKNLSLDLIFGLSGQTPGSYRHTLERALDL